MVLYTSQLTIYKILNKCLKVFTEPYYLNNSYTQNHALLEFLYNKLSRMLTLSRIQMNDNKPSLKWRWHTFQTHCQLHTSWQMQ